ncbi:hypothetical protein FRB90_001827, partial [Tulasnella sp. 427]
MSNTASRSVTPENIPYWDLDGMPLEVDELETIRPPKTPIIRKTWSSASRKAAVAAFEWFYAQLGATIVKDMKTNK